MVFVREGCGIGVGGWGGVGGGGGGGCGGKRTQWMHANSVGESMSDTCVYKNLPNLLRL